jgi:hypothetical protein
VQVAQHGVVDRLVDAGVTGFRDPDLGVDRRGRLDGGSTGTTRVAESLMLPVIRNWSSAA